MPGFASKVDERVVSALPPVVRMGLPFRKRSIYSIGLCPLIFDFANESIIKGLSPKSSRRICGRAEPILTTGGKAVAQPLHNF